ncbi:MAG: hypothetical protein A3F91_15830 [Flavobacteria bacterium RIFCSPLOWO2_12_FULL_35_11]|nr:MAG: hypothetical protein A3F91_15830 [Flavobacteria bacterium RIFCSPLOWO2_12_FULL_35_11]
MLTREQILKVARLLDQTGEPRPGYDHETDDFKGHVQHSSRSKNNSSCSQHIIKLRLDYEEDSESGDVRIVKR